MKREEFIRKAKETVKEKLTRKDLLVIQAVRTLDEADKAKGVLFERLQEWFRINFPELQLQNEETLLKLLEVSGSKEKMDHEKEKLRELVGPEKSEKILASMKNSMGAPFDDADAQVISDFAAAMKSLTYLRKQILSYIEKEAEKEFKNISYLAGALLAARLVEKAGSLQNLAKMPASTVQVIGAEKALFKHLRSGTKPPKHGVIFQSPLVGGAPLKQRGKISRALSTKLAIAAKADFYSKNFIAEKLKADLEKRLKTIRTE